MKRGPLTLCALAGAILLLGGADVWSPWIVGAGASGLVLAVVRPRSELSMLVPPCVIALACLAPWRVGFGATLTVVVAAAWSAGLLRRRRTSTGRTRGRMVLLMRSAVVAAVMGAVVVGQVTIEFGAAPEPVRRSTAIADVEFGPIPYNRVGESRSSRVPQVSMPPPAYRADVLRELSEPTPYVVQESATMARALSEVELLGSNASPTRSSSDAPDSGFAPAPWFMALAMLAVAIIALRLVGRLPSMPRPATAQTSGTADTAGEADDDVVAWYDDLVAGRGHRRKRTEPILAHGRRVAVETNDDRYRRLARMVSSHAYSGSPITRELTELFGVADEG